MALTEGEERELAELAQPACEKRSKSRKEWLEAKQKEGIGDLRALMFQSSLNQLKAGKIKRLAPDPSIAKGE